MGAVTADADLLQNGYTVSGLIGTRQDQFYLQLSGAATDRDSWSLLNGSRWPRANAEWRNPRTHRESGSCICGLAQKENPSQISAE